MELIGQPTVLGKTCPLETIGRQRHFSFGPVGMVYANGLAQGGGSIGVTFGTTSWGNTEAYAHGLASWLEYDVPLCEPGTWSLYFEMSVGPDRAQVQATLDGANVGAVMEGYAAAGSFTEFTRSIVVGSGTVTRRLRFAVTGKHASSTQYNFTHGRFGFDRTAA